MPFTKEDKILINNLFELKGYNARHLVRESPRKKTKMSVVSTSCCNRVTGWSTVVPAVADDAAPTLILLNWYYTKMASQEIIIICILHLII